MSFSLDAVFRGSGTRFRLYAQSPVLPDFSDPVTVHVSSPAGSLAPGPSDGRMYAIAPVGKPPYGDEDLPPFRGRLAPPAVPGPGGHFDHLEPDTDAFACAHVFGTVRRVLDVFELYAGGPIPWHFGATHPRLEMIAHVDWNNAQFGWGFMECGEGEDDQGVKRPFALNFDVLAHETGHGIVFSLLGVPTPETLTAAYRGFHESASDLTAMIAALHFDRFLDHVLRVTEGGIFLSSELDRIGELSKTRQIRSASNFLKMADVAPLDTPPMELGGKAAHTLGLPMTGAVFDVLVEFYLDRLAAFRLVEPGLAEGLRRAAEAGALEAADDAALREAYAREPEGFRAALADARDMVGLRFVETLRRLDPHGLTYRAVARTFMRVDREMTGESNQATIRDCFAWREILGADEDPKSLPAPPKMG